VGSNEGAAVPPIGTGDDLGGSGGGAVGGKEGRAIPPIGIGDDRGGFDGGSVGGRGGGESTGVGGLSLLAGAKLPPIGANMSSEEMAVAEPGFELPIIDLVVEGAGSLMIEVGN